MIDWNQVKSLQNDVGHDEFDEIFDLFLDEVEGIVTKLCEAPNVRDMENDMHSLKGSALNLGFAKFSDMCLDGEKMSSNGNADHVDVKSIVACFYASKSIFLKDVASVI